MAEASFIQAAETELSCPVCRELFIESHTPKDLQCGHIICAPCLKQVVRTVRDIGNRIKCPECRTIMIIPTGGVDALRTNFKIRNLAEKHPKDKPDHAPKKNRGKMNKKFQVPLCEHHAGEKRHFFCCSCNDLVCQACLVFKHKGHNVEEVKDRYAKQKFEIQNILSETMIKILQSQEILTDLKNLGMQVEAAQRNEEQKIDKCKNKVLETAHKLKVKLQMAGKKKCQRIGCQLNQLQLEIEKAQQEHKGVLDVLERSTEHEYIIRHNRQLEKLKNINIQLPQVKDTGKAAAVFKEESDTAGGLGEVVLEEEQVNDLAEDLGSLMLRRPGVTRMGLELKQSVDVFGVTPLTWTSKNQLVVLESFKKEITTYSICQGRYVVQRSWRTSDGTWNPLGVAVSPEDGHFCVTMWDRTRIYSPQGTLAKEFKGPLKHGMVCVNITTNGTLILGHFETSGSLAICHPVNGMKKLKTSIPQKYMTLIRDTHVAMSDYETGKVIVMNIKTGQETLSINVPWVRGVCYDQKTNCLLVVANRGSDIEQYSYTSGKFVTRLMRGLNNGCYLVLSSSGILALTENGCVKLYKVIYKM